MNFLEYLAHLFIGSLVLLILTSAIGFHQQLFMKLEHQVDAVRTSIALYHLLKAWKNIENEHQHLKIQKIVGVTHHVETLPGRKFLSLDECAEWMVDMSVLIWNGNESFISHIASCAPGKIVLDKKIPKLFQVPFDWIIYYPIELWVRDKKLYLKYHHSTQIWVSGFDELKWNLKDTLEVELKWPNLPLIKWKIN